jgi:hypothetical protein
MNPSEYVSNNATLLSSFSDYSYMTINQTTGAVMEDKYWGTLLVNVDGNYGYPIPSDKTSIYIGLVTRDKMSEQRIHYVYFFDADNNLLSFVNSDFGFTENLTDIPAGTAYVRVGVNNSYSQTSEKEYKEAVEKGNLRIVINLY